MAEFLVLGAGMAGIGAALALQARGHDVRVIDRRGPGEETSHGNAGLIQAEAAEPYPMPRAPARLWQIATWQGNDIRWRARAVARMAPALWSYYRASSPARHARIAQSYARLTLRAAEDHGPLIEAAGLWPLIRRTGFGEIPGSSAAFEPFRAESEALRDRWGLAMRVVDGAGLCAEDPAFRPGLPGAVIWDDSWSTTDPGALTAGYAGLFAARGGSVIRAGIAGLRPAGRGWMVATTEGHERAAHVVVALGPWSPALLGPLGLRVPMILKRGYHGHFAMEARLSRPYFLTAEGVVLSSMARGLRITTGAELTGIDAPRDLTQLMRGERAARRVLPLGPAVPDGLWHGHRPCPPDMLPYLGGVPGHPGLWLDFGHGHHGLTLGPTTGALLAEMVEGRDDDLTRALSPGGRIRG